MANLFDRLVSPELQSGIKNIFSTPTLQELTGSVIQAGTDAIRKRINESLAGTPEVQSAARHVVVNQSEMFIANPKVWLIAGGVGLILILAWRR